MYTGLLLAETFGDKLDVIFHGFDMAIFQFFGNAQSGFLTTIAKIFTSMGSVKYVALIAVMGLVMCFFKRTRKIGLALVFAVIIGTLITNIIVKPTILRVRPYNTLGSNPQYWAWYLGAGRLCESEFSFPSGHTTGAFELATVLFLCHFKGKKKRIAWIFPLVAILTGASRIYLMVHYPSDVFAGVIVGIFAGVMGYLIGKGIAGFIQKRKIGKIVDLERLFKRRLSGGMAALIIAVAWLLCFGFSYVTSIDEGGDATVRCAYDREYDCQNEAQVESKKYPPIRGEYYCEIHWKQLNEQFQKTGSVADVSEAGAFSSHVEPVLNTDLFGFYNDLGLYDFEANFTAFPPVKMKFSKGSKDIAVTDQELIQQVFTALQGIQVGEEVTAPVENGEDGSLYYTFYIDEETAYTLGMAYPMTIFNNGKYYAVTDDNGAFDIIPEDYFEGVK